jgi:hypothetical protein
MEKRIAPNAADLEGSPQPHGVNDGNLATLQHKDQLFPRPPLVVLSNALDKSATAFTKISGKDFVGGETTGNGNVGATFSQF